jgi:hypothetical protein
MWRLAGKFIAPTGRFAPCSPGHFVHVCVFVGEEAVVALLRQQLRSRPGGRVLFSCVRSAPQTSNPSGPPLPGPPPPCKPLRAQKVKEAMNGESNRARAALAYIYMCRKLYTCLYIWSHARAYTHTHGRIYTRFIKLLKIGLSPIPVGCKPQRPSRAAATTFQSALRPADINAAQRLRVAALEKAEAAKVRGRTPATPHSPWARGRAHGVQRRHGYTCARPSQPAPRRGARAARCARPSGPPFCPFLRRHNTICITILIRCAW